MEFPLLKLQKGIFPNDPEIQAKIGKFDRLVFLLEDNVPDQPTDFEAEAEKLRKGLVILPRGTLKALARKLEEKTGS